MFKKLFPLIVALSANACASNVDDVDEYTSVTYSDVVTKSPTNVFYVDARAYNAVKAAADEWNTYGFDLVVSSDPPPSGYHSSVNLVRKVCPEFNPPDGAIGCAYAINERHEHVFAHEAYITDDPVVEFTIDIHVRAMIDEDIRKIALHEFGHVLGFCHSAIDSTAIMSATISDARHLSPIDLASVCDKV